MNARRAFAVLLCFCVLSPAPSVAAEVAKPLVSAQAAPAPVVAMPALSLPSIPVPQVSGVETPALNLPVMPAAVPAATALPAAPQGAAEPAIRLEADAAAPLPARAASAKAGSAPASVAETVRWAQAVVSARSTRVDSGAEASAPRLAALFDGSGAKREDSLAVPSGSAPGTGAARLAKASPGGMGRVSRGRVGAAAALLLAQPSLSASFSLSNAAPLAAFIAGAALVQPLAKTIVERARLDGRAATSARLVVGAAGGLLIGGAAALLSAWLPAAGLIAAAAAGAAALWHSGALAGFTRLAPADGAPRGLLDVKMKGGRAYAALAPEDFNRLLMLSATLERGTGEKDLTATRSWDMEFPWYLRRVGDHVELVRKNVKFRAEPGTPMGKTLAASIADSPVAKARIVEERGGRVVVALDELFTEDLFDLRGEVQASYRGSYEVDKDLTRLEDARAYPRNVELRSRLAFRQTAARGWTQTHLGDTRNIALTLRYSLSALPEAPLRPRAASPVVGHFVETFQDWSDDQKTELDTRVVRRWRLEKTDPSAAVSPVKNPIVYWIDPTVPQQYRAAITRGILAWNGAFERVGLKDAILVKEAPEDGTFDSSDARYNVIKYYLERDSGYAIGPTRSDPFTGEIYNAGVNISAFHARGSLGLNFKDLDELDLYDKPAHEHEHKHGPSCRYGELAAREAAMTLSILESRGDFTEEDRRRFVEDYMTDLVLHEVGHTLGLRHNFVAKGWRAPDELAEHDDWSASVMDYAPVNLAAPGKKQGRFWMTELGPYDYWAIEYAYKPLDPKTEKAELEKIAARAESDPALRYLTDEDLVGIDPSVEHFTLGNDILEYCRRRAAVVRELWQGLEKKASDGGADAFALYKAWIQGWTLYHRLGRFAAKHVGGMTFTRRSAASPEKPSFAPISAARQREALDFLAENVFSDKAFDASPTLLRALAPQRQATVMDEGPELTYLPYTQLVLEAREGALEWLMASHTLQRIVESEKLVEPGEDRMTVAELLTQLSSALFEEFGRKHGPRKPGTRAISVMRREVQMQYVARLIELADHDNGDDGPEVRMQARMQLTALDSMIRGTLNWNAWDPETRAHLTAVRHRIRAFLERDRT